MNIFAGTNSGGIFLSTNNGTNWVPVNTGLTNFNIHALTISGSNLFAGTEDAVWKRSLSEMIYNAIALTPKHSVNTINTQHCVTATVTDLNGVFQVNELVDFLVRGTHSLSGSGSTNTSGQVQFCYTGTIAGCDTIFATVHSTGKTDTAYKCWDNPLPVELSSFTTAVDNNDITLTWNTVYEINNSGFDIERKADNSGIWSTLTFIKGNGSTRGSSNYTYIDKNLNSGKYNYRLKQIDFNGNFEYFNLRDEVIIGIPNKFILSQNYPNPFNPSTKIYFELPMDGNIKISVYDNTGKLVSTIVNEFKSAGYHSILFNASNHPSGVYFYTLISGSITDTKKMLLLK